MAESKAKRAGARDTVAPLLEKLDLEALDRDFFIGYPGEGEGRLFGGLVAAQSTIAVGRTVDADATLHSLHAYFLRPGYYDRPIRFVVDRIRDGRTFTTRRVVAHQGGEAIFNLSASFSRPQEGIAHQDPMPEVPEPEELEDWVTVRAAFFDEVHTEEIAEGPIAVRLRNDYERADDEPIEPLRPVWMRLNGPPPASELERIAILVYASDRTLMGSALRRQGIPPSPDVMLTSLDHAFYLHEVPALDDWWVYTSKSPMARSGRAMAHGAMYTKDGRQFASVIQEGLVRQTKRTKR